MAISAMTTLMLCPPAPANAADTDVTFESLLEQLVDQNRLAEFPDPPYVCGQFSSYDRNSTTPASPETWFANRDFGNVLRVEKHGERTEGVLMDVDGPGAIVRIWSANPRGVLRIYLDGESSPSIVMPMDQWLGGGMPIGEPLSAVTAGGYNSYLPIPFASRCKVTCDAHDELYYQINYRSYPEGTTVETFRNVWGGDAMQVVEQYNERLSQSAPPPGERITIEQRLGPGESVTIFEADDGGAISMLELKPAALDRTKALRGCLLFGDFDGRRTVSCPLGDFFGSAPGLNPYESRPMTVSDGGTMTSRWFMPFRRSARLTLENTTDQVMFVEGRLRSAPHVWNERSMHFHALWRSEGPMETRPRRDWNYATVEGKGVWVGDALHVGNSSPQWWGEGDEKIYVDGESFPSHFGTGTEDYYGYAWCSTELFTAPLHNQTRCDGPGNFGFTSVNRFRALDAIPFEESLRFDMELWHQADTTVHYAVTSWFYGRNITHNVPDPPSNMRDLLPPNLEHTIWRRTGAIEGEDLEPVVSSHDCEFSIQQMGTGAADTWSSMAHLFVQPSTVDDYMLLKCPVDEPGEYEVIVYLTRAADYGVVQCSIDGRKAGDPIDLYHPGAPQPPQAHSLGVHYLARVGFSLGVRVVGSNEKANEPSVYWGLDCLLLKPAE